MRPPAPSAPISRTRSTPTPCTVPTRWRTPRSRSRTSSRLPTSTAADLDAGRKLTDARAIAIELVPASVAGTGDRARAADAHAVNVPAADGTGSKTNLFDLDRASLERFFEQELGEKKFRAHQVMKWIHH